MVKGIKCPPTYSYCVYSLKKYWMGIGINIIGEYLNCLQIDSNIPSTTGTPLGLQ